jgi:RNA-binding protein
MNASTLAARDRKRMRQIAHHLDPVILIGDAGVTDAVIAETTRALSDHELIKVRIAGEDRTARREGTEHLAAACEAQIVQTIGKVVVLYRRNPDAKPKLSNLRRYSAP